VLSGMLVCLCALAVVGMGALILRTLNAIDNERE
jgi:hypothetical protein